MKTHKGPKGRNPSKPQHTFAKKKKTAKNGNTRMYRSSNHTERKQRLSTAVIDENKSEKRTCEGRREGRKNTHSQQPQRAGTAGPDMERQGATTPKGRTFPEARENHN